MKRKKIIFYFLVLLFISLIIISFTSNINFYKDEKKIYEEITNINTLIGEDNESDIDFLELKKINKEVVGWIEVLGSKVDYPFVQTTNNSFYLNHTFNRNYNVNGWVFMDYRDKNFKNKNTIIYAHGIYSNALFGSLIDIYNSSSWYQDNTKHYINITTPDKKLIYKIFSIYVIKTTNDYIETDFKSINEYRDFLIKIKNRSYYNFNEEVLVNDKIITLSTCYNKKEKLVIQGKLI